MELFSMSRCTVTHDNDLTLGVLGNVNLIQANLKLNPIHVGFLIFDAT